jgi:hypothetical protein
MMEEGGATLLDPRPFVRFTDYDALLAERDVMMKGMAYLRSSYTINSDQGCECGICKALYAYDAWKRNQGGDDA